MAYVVLSAGCGPNMPGRDGGDGALADATASDGAACVAYNPGTVAPPPAGVMPVVDIAPCPANMANMGGSATCTAANGCDVVYDSLDTSPLTPSYVSCRVNNGRCLLTFDSAGAPQYGACPTLEFANATCVNNFSLREVGQSNFTCGASEMCTDPSGLPSTRFANVQRNVDGTLSQSPCPAQCSPLV